MRPEKPNGLLFQDNDSQESREETFQQVKSKVALLATQIKEIVNTKDREQTRTFILRMLEDLARIILRADINPDIYSTENTAIIHGLGSIIWRSPAPISIDTIENYNINKLIDLFIISDNVDYKKFAEGIYLLIVLLHKYRNGNGRLARIVSLISSKLSDNSDITDNETRNALGIIDTTTTKPNSINLHSDFKRLLEGMYNFGLKKGFTEDEIDKVLKLHQRMPEESIQLLSDWFKEPLEITKEEFISFMVLES